MKLVIIGYVFSMLTSLLLAVEIYGVVAMFNGAIYMLIPAIICFYISTFFAWVIGDMCDKYGEGDE